MVDERHLAHQNGTLERKYYALSGSFHRKWAVFLEKAQKVRKFGVYFQRKIGMTKMYQTGAMQQEGNASMAREQRNQGIAVISEVNLDHRKIGKGEYKKRKNISIFYKRFSGRYKENYWF